MISAIRVLFSSLDPDVAFLYLRTLELLVSAPFLLRRKLQPKPRLELVGIEGEALPVASFTSQDKTEQRGVENQHRRLEVFRNVKTLDPNAAEMPPQRGHLPPSDGHSADDCC